MSPLERRLYIALLGARTIVSATANVNPAALRILRLVDDATGAYKTLADRESLSQDEEEDVDATGN